jgi:hypothetical protein
MQGLFRGAGLLLTLALALPLWAADENKDAKKKPEAPKAKKDTKKGKKKKKAVKKAEPKPEAKPDKVVYGGTLVGVLTHVGGNSQKDFAIEVSQRNLVVNPAAAANLAVLQQQQRAALFIRDPVQRQQQIVQLAIQMQQTKAGLYSVEITKTKVELHAVEDMKVRTASPPVELGDNGKPKRYTAKELKALRGNSKLPGYQADFDSLRANQVVRVYLAGPKPQLRKKKPRKKGEADAADDDLPKPDVVMVLVLREAPPKQ